MILDFGWSYLLSLLMSSAFVFITASSKTPLQYWGVVHVGCGAATLSPACFHLDPSNLNVRPLLKRFPTELSPKFLLFLPCNIKFNRINFPFDGFSLSLSKYRLVVTNSPHRASVFKHFGEFIITCDVWNFSTDRNERKLLILIHIYEHIELFPCTCNIILCK